MNNTLRWALIIAVAVLLLAWIWIYSPAA